MTPLGLTVEHFVRCLEAAANRPQKCAQCKGVMPRSPLTICDPCRAKAKRYHAAKRAARRGMER